MWSIHMQGNFGHEIWRGERGVLEAREMYGGFLYDDFGQR